MKPNVEFMKVVEIIKPFLNLELGQVLYLNTETDRYEYKARDEDTSADFKSVTEKNVSIESWLVEQNIGEYFMAVPVQEELPLDEIEPMEVDLDVPQLTKDVLIAKINADSAEKIARIHAESAERIAGINKPEKDWGVHSDGFQGGF